MRRKTYPSSGSWNPSCCRLRGRVQLGTLHIVKICSWRQRIIARRTQSYQGCVYGRSLSHYRGVNQNHAYFGGLESGDWIILEYSGPWSLEAEVTSKGARQWKYLLKSHCAVGVFNFAEHERAWSFRIIKRRLVAVYFSPSLLINWVYIRPKGG